jgi:hypothetical protein
MAEITLNTVKDLQTQIEQGKQLEYLEEFAQHLATSIHTNYDFSVLTRVYVNFPYQTIPEKNQTFVNSLAQSVGVLDKITQKTPILSLMGTYGKLADWRSRHLSKGHVGIPLISTDFIQNIPMMARLLADLKVDIEGIQQQQQEAKITSDVFGKMQGMFFIEDAATQVDGLGRKIIAAQDFVAEHKIKSVFGFGGEVGISGSYFVVVVFTNEILANAKVRLNLVLNNPIKQTLMSYFKTGKFFK